LGIVNGIEFWPKVELRPRSSARTFRYRFRMPPRVANGALALVAVSRPVREAFERHVTSDFGDVGLVLKNLGAAETLAVVDLPRDYLVSEVIQ
jgi:hypothetical protein